MAGLMLLRSCSRHLRYALPVTSHLSKPVLAQGLPKHETAPASPPALWFHHCPRARTTAAIQVRLSNGWKDPAASRWHGDKLMPAGSSPGDSNGARLSTDCTQKLLFLREGGCKGRISSAHPLTEGGISTLLCPAEPHISITRSHGGCWHLKADGFWMRGSKLGGERHLKPLLKAPAPLHPNSAAFHPCCLPAAPTARHLPAGSRKGDEGFPSPLPSSLCPCFWTPPSSEEAPAAAEMQDNKPVEASRISFPCLATNTDCNNPHN